MDMGQFDAARAEYEKALALQQKLVERYPTVPRYEEALAYTHNNLGILFTDLGQREAAQAELEKGIAGKKHLAEKYPTFPAYQVSLGGSYCELAQWFRKGSRAMECLTWCDKAIAVLTPVYRAEPRDITARRYLDSSYQNRALVYVALGKYADALPDWDKALELTSPEVQPKIRARRISSRVQTGHVLEAIADSEELTKLSNWNPVEWYDFACAYAVAAAKYPDKKQAYGDRAVELLRIAVKNGWKDAAHMAKDCDMDALRERADYKKLIAEMEASKKP
jgi:tetratricopeptide (TPR) repeat protein